MSRILKTINMFSVILVTVLFMNQSVFAYGDAAGLTTSGGGNDPKPEKNATLLPKTYTQELDLTAIEEQTKELTAAFKKNEKFEQLVLVLGILDMQAPPSSAAESSYGISFDDYGKVKTLVETLKAAHDNLKVVISTKNFNSDLVTYVEKNNTVAAVEAKLSELVGWYDADGIQLTYSDAITEDAAKIIHEALKGKSLMVLAQIPFTHKNGESVVVPANTIANIGDLVTNHVDLVSSYKLVPFLEGTTGDVAGLTKSIKEARKALFGESDNKEEVIGIDISNTDTSYTDGKVIKPATLSALEKAFPSIKSFSVTQLQQ